MERRDHRTSIWRNKTFIAVTLPLTLLALILLVLLLRAQVLVQDHQLELQDAQEERKGLDVMTNRLLELEQADALVILEGRYQDAMDAYRLLAEDSDTVIGPAVQARIDAIGTLLTDQHGSTQQADPKDLLLAQYRNRIEELGSRLLVQEHALQSVTDSLQARVADLSAALRQQDKELGKKEQVQVITFNSNKGQKIHYLGEVQDGKAHGGGVGIWSTGSVYRGDWRNNLRHGQGTFEWADGERYEGTYVDGIREGLGTYHWPSGDRYVGQWRADRRNGPGTLYDMDGSVRYQGAWKDDKPID
jgi:hypothetical protein